MMNINELNATTYKCAEYSCGETHYLTINDILGEHALPINKGETFYQEIRQMAPRIDLASDKFVPFVEKHLQERVKNPSHLCGKPKPLWANFSQTVRFLGLKTE